MIWLFLFMFCVAHNKMKAQSSCFVNIKTQQHKLCRKMVNKKVTLSDWCYSHWPS